jgi:hypothetical protein
MVAIGIAAKIRNQAPAARIFGRKGFVSVKPYLEWLIETMRKPEAYNAIAMAATPFDRTSTTADNCRPVMAGWAGVVVVSSEDGCGDSAKVSGTLVTPTAHLRI